MKFKTAILLLFFVKLSFAQVDSISNSLSELHKEIKGTTYSIIPIDGWSNSINFNGFQQKKRIHP